MAAQPSRLWGVRRRIFSGFLGGSPIARRWSFRRNSGLAGFGWGAEGFDLVEEVGVGLVGVVGGVFVGERPGSGGVGFEGRDELLEFGDGRLGFDCGGLDRCAQV